MPRVHCFRTLAVPLALLLVACARSPARTDRPDALALLRSADPDTRREAVARLASLAPSPARREALSRAVRDEDARVRLLAALVVLGDDPREHLGWLPAPQPRAPTSTPNPQPAAANLLSVAGRLVYLDPWFAGTMLPGALVAVQDPDARVQALGRRALARLEAERRAEQDGA